jgi:uncharacterized protein (DUF924 family)
MKAATQSQDVLDFWFGEVDSRGMSSQKQQKLWFNPPPGTDETIKARFGHTVEMALAGRLEEWAASPGGLTALVILLDQFTRNIFRGSAAAYSGDARALALARLAAARDWPASLPIIYRVFLCMPFEHAEELEAQDEGLTFLDDLLTECSDSARPHVADFRRYMAAHREVIARFGRFPHRNHILGRTTTAEESAYLEKHGGF